VICWEAVCACGAHVQVSGMPQGPGVCPCCSASLPPWEKAEISTEFMSDKEFIAYLAKAHGLAVDRLACTELVPMCMGRAGGTDCTCGASGLDAYGIDVSDAYDRWRMGRGERAATYLLAVAQERIAALEFLLSNAPGRGWLRASLAFVLEHLNLGGRFNRRKAAQAITDTLSGLAEAEAERPQATEGEARQQLDLFAARPR